jgi:hypothetical protein
MANPNSLQPVFGPSIPVAFNAVPLAFISAPLLKHDVSVALLSAERYVRENYGHLRSIPLPVPLAPASGTIHFLYGGTGVNQMYPNSGGFNQSKIVNDLSQYELQILCDPITVKGLYLSQAASWLPIVSPGCVWRRHIVKTQEFDRGTVFDSTGAPTTPASGNVSWLCRSGLLPGDNVILIYTVPETMYGSLQTSSSSTYPGPQSQLRLMREQGTVVGRTRIRFRFPLKVLTKIIVDGRERFNGSFDGTVEDTYIKSIDNDLMTIELRGPLSPDSRVEIHYLTYAEYHVYNGYRNWRGTWYPFDANPEYGHFIGDKDLGLLRSAADCLLDQVTLYLIPSAYLKAEAQYIGDQVVVTLTFQSAFSWGETHFVRHLMGQNEEDIQARQNDGPLNTWGYAVFGRNYYDEAVGSPDDVFSLNVPSMMPLGKMVMTAPAALGSVSVADIRQRGGGLPPDFQFNAVNTSSSGLDLLRSYYDLGTWNGAAVQEGGVVEVQINSSLLDRFTHDQIVEMVKLVTLPGIDAEIVYKDDV